MTPGRVIEVMRPLPHGHLDCAVELQLTAHPYRGSRLELRARGPRIRAYRLWPWSPAVAGSWQSLLAAVRTGGNTWEAEPA